MTVTGIILLLFLVIINATKLPHLPQVPSIPKIPQLSKVLQNSPLPRFAGEKNSEHLTAAATAVPYETSYGIESIRSGEFSSIDDNLENFNYEDSGLGVLPPILKSKRYSLKKSSIWDLISHSTITDQLNAAIEELLKYMDDNSQTISESIAISSDGNYKCLSKEFKEISVQRASHILKQIPRERVPLEDVLNAVGKVWRRVQTLTHYAIFEEISDWAVKIISQHHPQQYHTLLEFIITWDLHFSAYKQAIKHVNLLTEAQITLIMEKLHGYLESDETDDEYKFYGKFNVYFINLAKNYQRFSKLKIIRNFMPPRQFIQTSTLEFIFKSCQIFDLFESPPYFNPLRLTEYLADLVEFTNRTGISTFIFTEQLNLIISLKRSDFMKTYEESAQVLFMNCVIESIGSHASLEGLFPHIPGKSAYVILILGNFDALLELALKILRPSFNLNELQYILSVVNDSDKESPLGILLTFLGLINLPVEPLKSEDLFMAKDLKIQLYSEIITSIQDQELSIVKDSKEDESVLCTESRLLSKSKQLQWTLPSALNENFYELLTTAEALMIPLLFIQRAFHKDYRKSKIVSKYLRAGKPNYHQLGNLINEILEEQCFSTGNLHPALQVIINYPTNSKRDLI